MLEFEIFLLSTTKTFEIKVFCFLNINEVKLTIFKSSVFFLYKVTGTIKFSVMSSRSQDVSWVFGLFCLLLVLRMCYFIYFMVLLSRVTVKVHDFCLSLEKQTHWQYKMPHLFWQFCILTDINIDFPAFCLLPFCLLMSLCHFFDFNLYQFVCYFQTAYGWIFFPQSSLS